MSDTGVRSIEELRNFAAYLKNMSGSMVEAFDHARQEMYRVNEGWTDTENEKFMGEFEQSVAMINRIAEHMEHYGIFINRKCDIRDQYIGTRL